MSKSNAHETDLLELQFNATALPWNANGSLYVSLHTADPGETGTAVTNEATYTGYARKAVARNSGGWTVSGNQVSNTADVTFDPCTAGSNTITHFGIVDTASGAGILIYSGALSAGLAVSAGITPKAVAGALVITED